MARDGDDQIGSLIHALRTPLMIVEGFADALVNRGDVLSEAERAEYLERIGDAAREMRHLLDSVRR
jgi:signal transduction histidine kinase